MKDPLHKDNIDELLQNTLGRYEEMPSDAVWTGIERDLGQSPRRRRRFVLFWAMGLLLLISAIAVFYFKTKLSEKAESQTVVKEGKIYPESAPAALPGEFTARTPAAEKPAHEPAEMEGDKTKKLPSGGFNAPPMPAIHNAGAKKYNVILSDSFKEPVFVELAHQIENQGNTSEILQTEASLSGNEFPNISAPVFLAVRKPSPLKAEELPGIASLPSSLEKRSPRLYAGAVFMPLILWQSVETVRQRPVRPGTLPVAITAEAESPSLGYVWGIDLGIAANQRWSFWSGAQIRNLQTGTTHRAKMRRADGQWPGGSDTDLRFRYMLNTPAGGVAVDVRMEQVDSTLNLPSAEPVSFDLHTTQSLQYATIPFLVKYHGGQGRWRFFASGGLSANFLISNTLEIDRFASRSLRFRPSRFIRPYAGNEYLRTFSLDFRIGAGVRYQVSRNAGLSFEPVYFGQLTGANSDPYLQTSSRSLGLNAAVWYKF